MDKNKNQQIIQKIEDYLFSLSEKEKINIYMEYCNYLKHNKKLGYILHPTTDRDFSSFYDDDSRETDTYDLYSRFEEDDEKLLLLWEHHYGYYYGYYNILEMKEIVDFIYSYDNYKLHSKIMILFSYTTSYTKGVDYFHKEIFCFNDLEYSVKSLENMDSFYLYVCPFPQTYFQNHSTHFRENVFPELIAYVWHPNRFNKWKYITEL